MLLGTLSLLVTAAGAGAIVLSLRLRRATTMVTGFWVVLVGQIAAETLVVGGLCRQLHPGALAVAAVIVSGTELVGCHYFARDGAKAALRHLVKALRWALRQVKGHPLVLLLALLVLGQYAWQVVLTISLPPISYDSLSYHLIGPATWIQHGAIVHSKQNTYSDVYPQDQEALTAWVGTFLHSLQYAGLSTLPFVAMAASAVTMMARNLRVRPHLALVGGLGFIAMPAVFLQASTAYVDIAAAATALSALGFLLVLGSAIAFEKGIARGLAGHLVLAGIAAGLAAGIKSTGLVIIPVVGVISFVQFVRVTDIRPDQAERTTRPRAWVGLACWAVPITALAAFWYLRTWVTWNSPFYPATVLGFQGLGTARQLLAANEPLQLRHAPFGQVGAMVKTWLFDLHRHTFIYDQRLGGFGLQWPLVVVPAVVVGTYWFARRRPSYLFGLVVPGLLLAFASSAPWWARYTIALAGLGCVCLALCLERLALMSSRHEARQRRWRVPGATVTVLTAVFVAATAVSMWWATTPTDYEALVKGVPRLASPEQLVHIMASPDPEAVLYPWFAYTKLNGVVPGGTTLAEVSGTQIFTYPLVGEDLQRRLISIGNPETADQLANALVAAGVRFVLLTPVVKPLSLSGSVAADPARFRPLTSGGLIDGSDVYELGHWPVCTDPNLQIVSSTEDTAARVLITGRLTDSCGAAADIPIDLYEGNEQQPIYTGSDRVVATRNTSTDGSVTFNVAQPPFPARFFLRTSSQPTGRPSPGATASGVVTPDFPS